MTVDALGITDNDQIIKADQYRPLIVAYNNGAAVRSGMLPRCRIRSKTRAIVGTGPTASRECADHCFPAARRQHY